MPRVPVPLDLLLLGCIVICLCLPGSGTIRASSVFSRSRTIQNVRSIAASASTPSSSDDENSYAVQLQNDYNASARVQIYQLTSGLRPGRGDPVPDAGKVREFPAVDISFYNFRGYRISGWLAINTPHAPVVILLHGTPGNRVSMISRAAFLYQHGYNVMLFDFQSYGRSQGILSTLGMVESEDILSAIDYLHSRSDTSDSKIGLLGLSMGATASVLAAARSSDILAVVAESCPVDATRVAGDVPDDDARTADKELVEQIYGVDITQARPIDAISKLSGRTAVFLINGDSDSVTPLSGMYELYQNSSYPRQYWVVPGAEHAQSFDIDTSGYESRVDSFFDTSLASA